MDISELESRGIPRNIAEFLLEKFRENPDRLLMFLNSLQKDIIVFKMKISFSIYSGVVILFLNKRSGSIDFVRAYFSTDPEITKQNIELPWKELVKKISEGYSSFRIDEDISFRVQKLFYSDDNFRKSLLKVTEEGKTLIDIRRFLYTYIPFMFGDDRAVVRFSYERIDLFEFYNFLKNLGIEIPKSLKFIELGKFEATEEEPKGIYEFEVQPVLAPIEGITVSEMKQGDIVYVTVNPEQSTAELFSVGKEERSTVLFVKKLDFGRYLVYVELGPGFIGKFITKEDIKIKAEKTKSEGVGKEQLFVTAQPQQKQIPVEFTNQKIEEGKVSEGVSFGRDEGFDNKLVFWQVNIAIIAVGIAVVLILLLFM